MSISSEISRIGQNVSDSLDAVAAKGVTVPTGANSDSLPSLIAQIPTGGSTVLNYVTPEDYGAVGNGSTNDTDAISDAFNSGLPVVLTKNKNYFIMQVEVTVPLTVYGNGATISTQSITAQEYQNGGQRLLIFPNAATSVHIQDVKFYTTADQTITGAHPNDGSIPNRSMRCAIACYGVERIEVERCTFTNFDNPILGQRSGSDTTYQYIAKNGWFKDLQLNNCLMGFMGYFCNIVIDGCEINEDPNALSGEHGIYLLVDALETCNIVSTNIYTYNGTCGSCIQFYPSDMNATLKSVAKREYRIDNCILIGDAFISNAKGGNVIASGCTMKIINYNTTARRHQFECALAVGNGSIAVYNSYVDVELQDNISSNVQNLSFYGCDVRSNKLTSDRMTIRRAYNTEFDNVALTPPDGSEYINCRFKSSIGVLSKYYVTATSSTTSSRFIGCIFESGTNVNAIASNVAGTVTMIDIVSSLPTGSNNTGLTVFHKIDPTGSEPVLPTVSSSDNGKVLQVVNGAWAAASMASASGVSF